MKNICIRTYQDQDKSALLSLWSSVLGYSSPHNNPERALLNKLAHDGSGLLLVALDGDTLCGSVMGGYDGHRGWIYSLAVAETCRKRGIGSALVTAVVEKLKALGCVKVNLQIYGGNAGVAAFYEKLGFAEENRISMGKTLP
ncbi:MAG: GNAT family acetyltransferase [Spirochaetales bacterium]|nr:GNAT family acetyltransferase [Spirochaetales bacterium]